MAKLWTAAPGALHPAVEHFCFAADAALDGRLVRYDILGSLAHAQMLRSIGVLDKDEWRRLQHGLRRVLRAHERGRFTITTADEDVHTAVETRLGRAGEKLHTARSRNDQVLTDMRLLGLEQLCHTAIAAARAGRALLAQARRHEFLPMPGYTHLQRAMPSSYGMWMGAYGEELADTLVELDAAYTLMDQCPLGSGAGYGVGLKVDRRLTAKLLGFSRVQNNSLYCQNSRGHFEAVALSALASLTGVLGRLASDICLFCSEEFGFLKLSPGFTTGSSIMPQKRNPDPFELIRAKAVRLAALEQSVRLVTHGLISGYSKDLQEIKGPVIEAFDLAPACAQIIELAAPELVPNKKRLAAALTPDLYAADHAYDLVKQGVPFRRAYHRIKGQLDRLEPVDAEKNIRSKAHFGATGRLGLKENSARLRELETGWARRLRRLRAAWNRLLKD